MPVATSAHIRSRHPRGRVSLCPVRGPADFVDEMRLAAVVSDHWGFEPLQLTYLPVGGGAYHWSATTTSARRLFVTVDDLRTKPWLGRAPESVFRGLTASYRAAMQLRDDCGLAFVAAPLAATDGEPAVWLDASHSVSVLPFVHGHCGQWGEPITGEVRRELLALLAAIHQAPSHMTGLPTRDLAVPGRDAIEQALADINQPWSGGPLSEPARHLLHEHSRRVRTWLDELDNRRTDPACHRVLTHGEPHPGNLMHTRSGLVLLDWDTLAVAAPERDVWMLDDGTGSIIAEYTELTGHQLDPAKLVRHRRLWALTDVAAFTTQLRRPHRASPDAEHALTALRMTLTGSESRPWS